MASGFRGGASSPLSSWADNVPVAVNIRCHHGRAGGHRFQQNDAETFAAGSRATEHIGAGVITGQLAAGNFADDGNGATARSPEVVQNPRAVLVRGARPYDDQAQVVALRPQPGKGGQQVAQPLAFILASHEQDVGFPVAQPGQRAGGGETPVVNAVGYDPVGALRKVRGHE